MSARRWLCAVAVAVIIQAVAVAFLVAAGVVAYLLAWSALGDDQGSPWAAIGVLTLVCVSLVVWATSGAVAARVVHDRRAWWVLAIAPSATTVVLAAL